MDISDINHLLQQLKKQKSKQIPAVQLDTSDEEEEDDQQYYNQTNNNNNNANNNPFASSIINDEVTSDEEPDDSVLGDVKGKLKELKAKKIVVEFEHNQQDQSLQELRMEHQEKVQIANELFSEWIQERMDNYNCILEITTEDLPSYQQAQLTQLPEEPEIKDASEERIELWKRLQQTRRAYLKLAKYIELKQKALEDLKQEKENCLNERESVHAKYEREIESLEKKRRENEKRTDEYRLQLVDIKNETDEKRKQTKLLTKRIEKAQTKTAREVQFLAKQLLK